MKYRGVAYYPEAWPRKRWDEDIALMREAGINLVRMGEFAWARFEPEEGRFDLDGWIDICGRMGEAGIQVLACTPSAAPPAWLTSRYPETVLVTPEGRRLPHGGRRHYCPSSRLYREKVARVNARIAEAVRDNPAVMAWQVDNEIAPEPYLCHCEACAAGFREWLKNRYKTLQALNEAWGNVFWSGDFSDWDQIEPPRNRLSWRLDYQRFQDRMFRDFLKEQAQGLRAVRADWMVTANLWAGLNPAVDARLLNEELDVAAYDGYWDCYADREHYSSVWDLYRNISPRRRSFWLAETGAWNPCRTVKNSLKALRPWAFEAFAKGAESHIYFRWRQSRMGEENHPAILDWSGRPGRPYDQVRAVFREFEELRPRFEHWPPPCPDIAILFDYDSAVAGGLSDGKEKGITHKEALIEANVALNRMGTIADILPVHENLDLSGYRLLLLPGLEMVDPWLAGALDHFVEQGGVVLAQTRLAIRDRNAKYLVESTPAGLTFLFGVEVRERARVERRHRHPEDPGAVVEVDATGFMDEACGKAEGRGHMELLRADSSCSVPARYISGDFAGSPAVTERRHGAGWALYQGCFLDERTRRGLLCHALRRAGLPVLPPPPEGVEVISRGRLRFYLNHRAEAVSLPLYHPGQVRVGYAEDGRVQLDSFDVCVIEEDSP